MSALMPGITRGLSAMLGSCWSNARAGALRYTILGTARCDKHEAAVARSGKRHQACELLVPVSRSCNAPRRG